jgi:hypothetical protein
MYLSQENPLLISSNLIYPQAITGCSPVVFTYATILFHNILYFIGTKDNLAEKHIKHGLQKAKGPFSRTVADPP